jgi:hypothetical protein
MKVNELTKQTRDNSNYIFILYPSSFEDYVIVKTYSKLSQRDGPDSATATKN